MAPHGSDLFCVTSLTTDSRRRFEENQRPSVHASGYLVLKAGQAGNVQLITPLQIG